jgi:hypothetical protein
LGGASDGPGPEVPERRPGMRGAARIQIGIRGSLRSRDYAGRPIPWPNCS